MLFKKILFSPATTKEVPYTALHGAISAVDNIEKEIQDEKDEDKGRDVKKRLSKLELKDRLQQLETRLKTTEDLVKYLVRQQTLDINAKDSIGDTPLLLAAKVGNVTVLETLLEATGLTRGNVQADLLNKFGQDVLMCGTMSGNLQAVKYVITKTSEANFTKVDEFGYTAIHIATERGYIDIVKFLVGKWKQVKRNSSGRILSLSKTKDTGRTLLMLAVLSGEKKMVNFWLDSEFKDIIPINEIDDSGKTALMLGATNGYTEIVKLCCGNANVNLPDRDQGYSALMLACLNGHHETVKALLNDEKIDFKATDHQGRNILYLAARKCDKECLQVILGCEKLKKDLCGAINARTRKGDTTALTAVGSTHPDAKTLRRWLIEAGGYDVRTISQFQKELRFVKTRFFYHFRFLPINVY